MNDYFHALNMILLCLLPKYFYLTAILSGLAIRVMWPMLCHWL